MIQGDKGQLRSRSADEVNHSKERFKTIKHDESLNKSKWSNALCETWGKKVIERVTEQVNVRKKVISHTSMFTLDLEHKKFEEN